MFVRKSPFAVLLLLIQACVKVEPSSDTETSEAYFNGIWAGDVRVVDMNQYNPVQSTEFGKFKIFTLIIQINGTTPTVHGVFDDKNVGVELAPGKFRVSSLETNMVLHANSASPSTKDSGGFVESCSIHLTRKDDVTMHAVWLRTVNNTEVAAGSGPYAQFHIVASGDLKRGAQVNQDTSKESVGTSFRF